ncbi:uncharacterized protein LOC113317267 [Papaver somniferum]|uniref:uncharacterized protein LOC113317267 n=1 Tax=Papaver somniferum TaxID=3469 RepID=UPI000E6FE846|nr:uncharacterized protein LOC113317267 [Papaver somniferum]
MSGFWSATGDENKSIRELAYGHTSRYDPPTDHDVNSYMDCYGHFHSPEPQYLNPNDYAHMYQSLQGENEHFCNAQLTQSSLLEQLEAQITALEMQIREKSVASNSPRKSEMHACTLCGSLSHLVENCYILHAYRQSREGHENPKYEMLTDYEASSHWDHNQPFEGCDQYFINPNDHAHMYHPPQWEVETFCTSSTSCRQSVEENLVLIEPRFELNLLHDKPYSNASEFSFCSDPHAQPYTEYPYAIRIPTVEDFPSMEKINAYLDMILLHVQKEGREECQHETFVSPKELNSENSVCYPTVENCNAYSPTLEVDVQVENTNSLDEIRFSCIFDDDDDMVLNEVAIVKNKIAEFRDSETLEHIVETSTAGNSFDPHTSQSLYAGDIIDDLELVQLFCERKHDLGQVEISVDTNVHMHENIFDVSDSLPRSHHDISFDLPIHETKVLNDAELGFADLFNENEHDMLVSDFRRVCVGTSDYIHENNLDVPTSLPMSHTGNLAPNLDLVCNKIVKPTLLRGPNLGLELCASQVLLDYFASKYNTFKEAQLECALASLPVHNTVHFELDLVHDEPPKLRDFVPKSISVEKSRFGDSSFCFAASLAFLCYHNCVRLLKFLHSVFWVDPQLFRLLMYGEFFLCIIQ